MLLPNVPRHFEKDIRKFAVHDPNRPSIQLGVFKAFVTHNISDIKVSSHHIYLSIAGSLGYDLYGKISEKTWLSKSLYAAILYPERTATIKRFWKRKSCRLFSPEEYDFCDICHMLKKSSSQILEQVVGVHICWQDFQSVLTS